VEVITQTCPVQRVTDGPFQHFFGYYDKTPWDPTGHKMLGMRVAFGGRPPTPDDIAVIGLIDLDRKHDWKPVAETTAWCWQQGTMLQWLPGADGRSIIFNTRSSAGFGSTILDVTTGARRDLPRPVYGIAPHGRCAVSLNFARVHRTRPGYGYVGVRDDWQDQLAPNEDGITFLDLATGSHSLIVSLAQVAGIAPEASMENVAHWVNHLQFNPTGDRFAFLHRWGKGRDRRTRLFTARPDGTGLYLLEREGVVSHYDWMDARHILAWSRHCDEDHYHLYEDQSREVQALGADVLQTDGHCSYSPDRNWILTDTYPDAKHSNRTLILYHPGNGTRFDIGRFYSPPQFTGEIRCDLHPRWSRDGRRVSIDSLHEEQRQMYIVDVSEIVES